MRGEKHVVRMETRQYRCGILTPIAIAGANKNSPELREPSLKGLMRYWWRVAKAEPNQRELFQQEAKLFGSAIDGGSRSPVVLSIAPHKFPIAAIAQVSLLPHRDAALAVAIKPGAEFSITMSAPTSQIDLYSSVLELALLLGGLGRRSRRGFGAIEIRERDDVKMPRPDLTLVHSRLDSVRPNLYEIHDDAIRPVADVHADYPYLKHVQIGKDQDNYQELLRRIGAATSRFKDDSLGYAHGQHRFASPVWVSVVRRNSHYAPIVTTLHTALPGRSQLSLQQQDSFRRELLR